MISVIAFDYGGVIEVSGPKGLREIMETLSITKDEWFDVYYRFNHLTNTGIVPWIEVVLLTAKELGASSDQLTAFKELLLTNSADKKLNAELIERIKSNRIV